MKYSRDGTAADTRPTSGATAATASTASTEGADLIDLAELLQWLGTQRYAITDARDEIDRSYRLGWSGAIDHLRRELALRGKRP